VANTLNASRSGGRDFIDWLDDSVSTASDGVVVSGEAVVEV